jgi:ATP-dependent protease ClpP protease subunit
MYAEMTNRSRAEVEEDISYDNYMTAEQAQEYGLVDIIPSTPL